MSTLSITRNYADGEILLEADLDEVCDDVETFLNGALLSDVNIANVGITASSKLIDATITAAKLASDSVTTAKILDANVTAAKLASDSVTTAKILDANVTTAKIADSNVTADKIAANNVTAGKLANGAVDATARIADGIVTPAKRSTCLQHQAGTAGTITTSATNQVTFTATGRPILIHVSAYGATAAQHTLTPSESLILYIYKNGSTYLAMRSFSGTTAQNFDSFQYIDAAPAAGAITYDLRTSVGTLTQQTSGSIALSIVEL